MKGDLSVRMAGKAIFDVDDATCQEIYQQNPVLPRLYADYKNWPTSAWSCTSWTITI